MEEKEDNGNTTSILANKSSFIIKKNIILK